MRLPNPARASKSAVSISYLFAFLGIWICFVSKTSWSELTAGLATSVLALLLFRLLAKGSLVPLNGKTEWLQSFLKTVPVRILRDGFLVLSQAISRPPNRLSSGRILRVKVQGAPEAYTESRIAWSTLGTSLTPNVYVLAYEPDTQEMIIHELVPTPEPLESKIWWPP